MPLVVLLRIPEFADFFDQSFGVGPIPEFANLFDQSLGVGTIPEFANLFDQSLAPTLLSVA